MLNYINTSYIVVICRSFFKCYVRLNGNNFPTVKLISFRILKVMILLLNPHQNLYMVKNFDNQTLINHKFWTTSSYINELWIIISNKNLGKYMYIHFPGKWNLSFSLCKCRARLLELYFFMIFFICIIYHTLEKKLFPKLWFIARENKIEFNLLIKHNLFATIFHFILHLFTLMFFF